jgi:Ion channel
LIAKTLAVLAFIPISAKCEKETEKRSIMRIASPTDIGRPLAIAIGLLSLVIFFVALILFVVGCMHYTSNEFIDYRLNLLKPADAFWLCSLLASSLVAQAICMIALFMNLLRDKYITGFYTFCVFVMAVCPLSYCWLWWIYTGSNWSRYIKGEPDGSLESYSTTALVGIVVLALLVAVVTYLTMWTPEKDSYYDFWKLSEEDIRDWPRVCAKLKDAHTNRSPGFLAKMMDSMGHHVKGNIFLALRTGRFTALHKPTIVEAINEFLEREDAYEVSHFTKAELGRDVRTLLSDINGHGGGRMDLSFEDRKSMIHRLNRLLFEQCFSELEISPVQRQSAASKATEMFLVNIHRGLLKAPFWTLVFFFTIFLGITYLFGFAFAFHDKSVAQTDGSPALFMARAYSYNAREQPQGRGINGSPISDRRQFLDSDSWPEYRFYFDSNSATPLYRTTYDETRARTLKNKSRLTSQDAKDLAELNKQWREVENSKQVDRVLKAIEYEDNAGHGKGFLLVLKGSADDNMPEGSSYPSNYALSEARAQNMKYILTERLAKDNSVQNNWGWLILPQSNEVPLIPLSQQEAKEQDNKGRPSPEERVSQWEKHIYELKMGEDDKSFLATKLHSIKDLFADTKEHLSLEEKNSLINKVELFADLAKQRSSLATENVDSPTIEEQSRSEKLQQTKDDLDDTIEAVQHDRVEPDASKRSVLISLRPMESTHRFIPLSLMDYMYFSIYTITTTGYGDIIPTTTYSKFLCSLANILAVFFLVVFFNALLSIRGRHKGWS